MDVRTKEVLAEELIRRCKPQEYDKALKLLRRTGVAKDNDIKEIKDEVLRKTNAVDWTTLTK